MLDQHLTFETHLKYIKEKISRGIGILCKARKYLKESSLLTLYYAFIYHYFTYCNTVWGNTYSSFLEPLAKLQKRAIRIICGARKYDHTYPLFQQLSILSIKNSYYGYILSKYSFTNTIDNLSRLFFLVSLPQMKIYIIIIQGKLTSCILSLPNHPRDQEH